ncbi:MAG: YggS family pyridoxal phosphate-dependent enzyme [Nitrospirota bacterium]
MTLTATTIADRMADVYERIARAAERAGRNPLSVRLIGVTKGVGLPAIREAFESGLRDVGENRVQEALEKMASADAWSGSDSARLAWHLVGRLQSNKVRAAVGRFDVIHSVDSLRLGQAIDDAAARAGLVQRVLIQVNVGREPQKGGVAPEEVEPLWNTLSSCRHVRLDGLMAIPPAASDPEQMRQYFQELRRLGCVVGAAEYSMGMSGDFEIAVEEGATMVRVGTAIFGLRVVA